MGKCYIGIDLGTTNTRVWLVEGSTILERAHADVGARDTARMEGNGLLKRELRTLVNEMKRRARARGIEVGFAIGAGMLTSALGLQEVPHLEGPAGVEELRANIAVHAFREIGELPFLLVPGLRTGTSGRDAWDVHGTDVIRGEETLCVGMLESRVLRPGATLLNLGSHWKAISIDEAERVSRCVTDLSGELIYAVQAQTVLRSSVAQGKPSGLDAEWLRHGVEEERRSGLTRALFCVRLLDLHRRGDEEERMAFLMGVFISHSLGALRLAGMVGDEVVLCGAEGTAEAWQAVLEGEGIRVVNMAGRTEEMFVRGLAVLAAGVRVE